MATHAVGPPLFPHGEVSGSLSVECLQQERRVIWPMWRSLHVACESALARMTLHSVSALGKLSS